MLDARRLQVLRAVVAEGSISGAAAALGFTPSAISQSIAALEREARTKLFERAGRGIRPTQAGVLLARRAEAVAAQLREAEEALEALRAGEAGRLRVAAFATAGASLVPVALAAFRARHPGVELDLVIAEIDEALAKLRSGAIDVAVVASSDPPREASARDLAWTKLLEDPYRIVLPRAHPLAARPVVPLGELADEAWIATVSARCNGLPSVTAACARAGFTPRFAIEADEFATTIGFVAAGLGVAMVPSLALTSLPENVFVAQIDGDAPSRRVFGVSRAQAAAATPVKAMIEALAGSAAPSLQAAS